MTAPDRWLVLTAHVAPGDPLRDLVAEGLLALGGQSVLEEPGSLTTFLPGPRGEWDGDPSPDAVERFLVHAASVLGEDRPDGPPRLTWRWQANEDWAREWRRGLQPRRITDRVVVKPTWTTWEAAAGEVVIEIDPQMAFGTGEHATTRGCLRLIDRFVREDDRVLDIGSGSAILSIAAARLGAGEVVAIEYDPDANLNARENIERNGVGGRVRLVEMFADAASVAGYGKFELILANILSGVIRPLLPALSRALAPGGVLILSGILESEAAAVLDDVSAVGLLPLAEDREEGWWSAAVGGGKWGIGSRKAEVGRQNTGQERDIGFPVPGA